MDSMKALVKQGLYIFPVGRNKIPLVKWKDQSTKDKATIKAWWARWPEALIGIDCEKSNLIVIDLDVKKGKDGPDNLSGIELEHGFLPESPSVTTRSGGRHLYFNAESTHVKSSADLVASGVDIRSRGGYVVAPGSEGYAWDNDIRKFPVLPAWFRGLCETEDYSLVSSKDI